MDFFPFRGHYDSSLAGRLLFVVIRVLLVGSSYVLLLRSSTSPFCSAFPSACPPPAPDPHLHILSPLGDTLGLPSTSTAIFLGILLPSIQFALYNLRWRREALPLGGQGGAIQVAIQVNLFDLAHVLLFAYLAAANPTWSAALLAPWCPAIAALGLALHAAADESKHRFKGDARHAGKVYAGGVWGVVRHPNHLGFLVWRTAFATAAGGWAMGLFVAAFFVYLFGDTAVPVEEGYMRRKYGQQWERVTEKVPWKMLPGIW